MAKAAASLAVEPSSAPVVFRGFPHEGSTSFTEGIIPSTPIASPASLGSIIRNLSDWILCVYGRQRLGARLISECYGAAERLPSNNVTIAAWRGKSRP